MKKLFDVCLDLIQRHPNRGRITIPKQMKTLWKTMAN